VTGAGGFVGSRTVRALVEAGHEVHAAVRRRRDQLDALLPPGSVVECDLQAPAELEALVDRVRPELCIHCAWHAVPGDYLNSPENAAHLRSGLALAEALAAAGCRRFVGVGTCLEYAATESALTESSPTGPTTPYAKSKLALYRGLEQLRADTGMSTAWGRLFYLYGPFEDERRLVPSVILSLLEGRPARTTMGAQVRDFLHVDDVAAALASLAWNDLHGAVNIASGSPVTVRDLVLRIGEIVGRPELIELGVLPYPPGERMAIWADNRRLVESGWSPRFGIDDGLAETVGWWRSRAHG
jgi:UDP-glucuronate decarboxylase